MVKKIALLGLVFFFMTGVYAQDELNPYKYIIIPKKYDFLKKENQYRVNTYTKFLFDNEGFTTLVQGESYPNDLLSNPCIAVTADVEDSSNMFTTKLKLVLKNCHGNVVFTSIQGTSKLKEFDKTYIDALKKCFVSIEQLNYNFDPAIEAKSENKVQTTPVAEVKEEVKETEIAVAPVVAPANTEPKVESPAKQTTAAPVVAAVAVPVVNETKKEEEKAAPASTGTIARSYKNENISFFLIEQGDKLVAYVNESRIENYKKGELIGTFEKTSLPNVFRVEWKKQEQDIDETTAYFDDSGNLKIDIHRNGKIEVVSFSQVK